MGKLLSLIRNTNRAVGLSFKYHPKLTLGIFAVTIIGSVAPLFQAKILGDIVNQIAEAAAQATSVKVLLLLVLSYAGIWTAIRLSGVLELYLMKLWRDGTQHSIELMIFKKRTEIDLGHYENPNFQSLLLRAFSQGTAGPMMDVITNQFVIMSSLAVIIVSSFITSAIGLDIYLIVIVSSIPSFIIQVKYGHKVWGIWAEHSERQKIYTSMRSHILGRTGITQIKLLQNSQKILTIIQKALEAFRKDNKYLDTKRFLYQTGAALISAAGFGLSLWLIVERVINGSITVGTLVFVVSALGALIGSFNVLLARLATQIEKNLYLNDIFTVLDTKPFIRRSGNPVKLNLSAPPTIEFVNVGFKYQGREDWILKNVNLTINPGEKIALVGMNGAGKSTLVKLLSRVYDPTEGAILINGIDLREVDVDEWSSYLSVLLQDYLTYDLTVKESVGMGRSNTEINSTKIQEASELSGAHEFVKDWSEQYEQQLGKEFEGGIELSKGQKQKIALASTIYRDGLVMILDEPTAAIDALSEMRIFEAMEKAAGKHTLIVITHRFNTTQGLDKIIVLDKGMVVEVGTHKELLQHDGLYAEMFESQAKAFRSDGGQTDSELAIA